MKLLKIINPEHVSDAEVKSIPTREAVRAVVYDQENQIALLYVSRHGYYKLPGGGIEKDEDHVSALKRESLEEIGCDVEVIGEIGKIIEYRKFCSLTQISYCYLAKVKGAKGTPNLMPDEIEDGFQLAWVSLEEALLKLANNPGDTLESQSYIVPRDTMFIKTVLS